MNTAARTHPKEARSTQKDPQAPLGRAGCTPTGLEAAWQEASRGLKRAQGCPSAAKLSGLCLASAGVLPRGPPRPAPGKLRAPEQGPSCPPTLRSLQSWLGFSVKSRAHQAGGGDVSAGIQALVVRSERSPSPAPQIHPPTPLPTAQGLLGGSASQREKETETKEPAT